MESPTPSGVITYRRLPLEEWHRLKPIYESQGDKLPDPIANIAIVAEIDGEIIGMNGINSVVHAGPRWVHSKWRRMGIATEMGRRADQLIKELGAAGYFVFPSNEASKKLAERLGLKLMPFSVYGREF